MAELALRAMADVLQAADLTDQGILVELRLPLRSRRLDVLPYVSGSALRRHPFASMYEACAGGLRTAVVSARRWSRHEGAAWTSRA